MVPKLITLLTVNRIGAAGATQLADALQRNSTLTTHALGCKHDMYHIITFICVTAFVHIPFLMHALFSKHASHIG